MRKLMWFAVGFAAACGIAAYGMTNRWLPLGALLCLTAGVAAVGSSGKKILIRSAIAVLAGCTAGLAWFGGYQLLYLKPVSDLEGQEMELSVTASDYSYDTTYGTGVDAAVEICGRFYQIRLYINEKKALQPGDRIGGTFLLSLTFADEENSSTYYQGEGIFLMARQAGEISVFPAESESVRYFPARLRKNIAGILEALFPADVSAFTKALLLGDSSSLDYATDTAFKVSGIRHIIAVSGLHISVLYGFVSMLTLRRRYLTALVGVPVLALFAAVAGFTPSVVRACLMVLLLMLSQLTEREYDPPTALSVAVLVILGWNPLAVTSVSLQLSAGCVAGILLFNKSINSWLQDRWNAKGKISNKLKIFVCSSIPVTVSAMSLVTPLSAFYFGSVSLMGIVTNLLTLWVVTLIFVGLVIVCILYPLSASVAAMAAGALMWPVRYVLWAAKTLASFPLASVYTDSNYIQIWLVFVYVLFAVCLFLKKKKPVKLICLSVLGLCAALMLSWAEPLTDDCRITMLDVGQGQSILLQSDGRTFLVDCGGDDDEKTADTVAETLLSQGISRLDGIILTHYDRDHAGAIHNLLTRVDTDYLFLPDMRNEFELPKTDAATVYVWEDLRLTFGNTALTVYGPIYSGLSNENSLCVLFDTDKCDILITGDRSEFGERMLLRNRTLPDVDVLVAGHHGALDSTSEQLLRAVTPETVLISAARNNRYNHPHAGLLQRLEDFGCSVLRTDLQGTIIIRR